MTEHLEKAKKEKNDEFFTLYEDIENELRHYKEYLKGKKIYMPCDDPKLSNFWLYFISNKEEYQFESITATFYSPSGNATKTKAFYNNDDILVEDLEGDGDFRSQECRDLMAECDVVITNPPFSLWRQFFSQIMELEKDMIIVSPQLAFGYLVAFPYLQSGKIKWGYNKVDKFIDVKNGDVKKFGNTGWITTLPVERKTFELKKTYNPQDYPKWDNRDVIEVKRSKNLPKDYYGKMGVPVSFFTFWNDLDQLELLDITEDGKLNGKRLFKRIVVRRKNQE